MILEIRESGAPATGKKDEKEEHDDKEWTMTILSSSRKPQKGRVTGECVLHTSPSFQNKGDGNLPYATRAIKEAYNYFSLYTPQLLETMTTLIVDDSLPMYGWCSCRVQRPSYKDINKERKDGNEGVSISHSNFLSQYWSHRIQRREWASPYDTPESIHAFWKHEISFLFQHLAHYTQFSFQPHLYTVKELFPSSLLLLSFHPSPAKIMFLSTFPNPPVFHVEVQPVTNTTSFVNCNGDCNVYISHKVSVQLSITPAFLTKAILQTTFSYEKEKEKGKEYHPFFPFRSFSKETMEISGCTFFLFHYFLSSL